MTADGYMPLTRTKRRSLAPADAAMVAPCMLRYSPIAALSHERAREWLSDREHAAVALLGSDHRRLAWLNGRLLLKRLIVERLRAAGPSRQVHPRDVEIVSRDAAGRAARPTALLGGRPLNCSLSITHTDRHVLVAVAAASVAIGVDLVDAQFAPAEGFCQLWFTELERQRLCEITSPSAAAVWAIKEAVYKATNRGDPFMPQHIEVDRQRDGRLVCRAPNPAAATCQLVTWLTSGGEIAALATLSESTGSMQDD